MNTPSVALVCVFAAYTLLCWILFGPIPSLSSTYYLWKEKKNFSSAWNIFSAIVFLLCCLQYYYVKEMTLLFFVLSGASMWFLTIAAPYKTYPVMHYVPTVATIVFAFLAAYSEFGKAVLWPLGAFVAGSLVMKVLKVSNYLTWVELLAVVCALFLFIR